MPWFSSTLKVLVTPNAAAVPGGVTPTLILPVSYEGENTLQWSGQITSFPATMEQRVSWQTMVRRGFQHQYGAYTTAQVQALQDLFITQQGKLIPFKWYHLGGAVYYVRFDTDKISFKKVSPLLWEGSYELMQVHPSEIILDE